jgi:hypothetical protein
MKKVFLILLFLSAFTIVAEVKPHLTEVDRVRLTEAFKLSESVGNEIWPNWDQAPFATLLVTPDYEFLIRHAQPSPDFALIGNDSLLKSDVYFRKRQFLTSFLATFPAVNGISTIVIGQAENTNKKTSTPWIITVLHEHFHQLQESQPNYFQDIEELNLSRGDQTGMWMLNYAFPYDSPEVKQQFSVLQALLLDALQINNDQLFQSKVAAYLQARNKLKQILSPDDYKYFSFQLWKEGIARYTEYRVAKLGSEKHEPTEKFRELTDFEPFKVAAKQIHEGILNELSTYRIEDKKRELFYSMGAGEGLLLDKVNPDWQKLYFTNKFDPEKYFNSAR